MDAPRRARWLAWSGIVILALALPFFFLGGYGGGSEGSGWAIAGAIALHPAAFAGLGAFFTYRNLDEEDKPQARIARFSLPVIVLAIGLLWLFWV